MFRSWAREPKATAVPPWRSTALLAVAPLLLMPAAADTRDEQRRAFVAAEQALDKADRETYDQLSRHLIDYPLYPYLRLADLMGRLDSVPAEEVTDFLERYRGTAPGERLRRYWLRRLSQQERWQAYIDAYVNNGSETRECLYRRGLLAVGRTNDAFAGLERVYLTGSSLPDACDPLFGAWFASGLLDVDLVWRRIAMALEQGRAGVARFQRRYLPETQQPWLDQLLLIHSRPHELANALLPQDPRHRAAMLVHGIQRLSRSDPQAAATLWRRLQDHTGLSEMARDRIHAAIGSGLAKQGQRAGLVYLRRIQPREDNIELQQQRLRAALHLRAWADLAHWVAALPASSDGDGEWHYWLARALAERGDLSGAVHAFDAIAGTRSLWGFRAAELLGRPPALAHRPAPVDMERLQVLLASDTIARIRELQALGRSVDVTREWRELTRVLPASAMTTAAALAARLGLVTEAIFTLARAEYWDDLDLRFPLAQRALIEEAADRQGLPADWVYAVIRQESAFDADIASHAGAVGLMQLMPATAADMARVAGMQAPSTLALTDPRLNVTLGSRYLAAMRRRFDGNELLATAAYNAGPGAVSRWLPEQPMAADLWISEIPYPETRDYVRRVLTYRIIYAHKLGRERLRIGALLRPVTAPAKAVSDPPETEVSAVVATD